MRKRTTERKIPGDTYSEGKYHVMAIAKENTIRSLTLLRNDFLHLLLFYQYCYILAIGFIARTLTYFAVAKKIK